MCADYFQVAQDRVQWQVLVDTLISGLYKGGEFLNQLTNCELLKKEPTPQSF
jgi:hypothetical protein